MTRSTEPARRRCTRLPGRAAPITVALLVVASLVAAVFVVANRGDGADSPDAPGKDKAGGRAADSGWYAVERRTFDITVSANGELEAHVNTEIKSQVEGNNTIIELVDEGTSVKVGDVLVRLADDSIRAKIEQEELDVERVRAEKIAAEQALVIEQSAADSTRRAAELKLDLAKLELAKWQSGDHVQKQRELKLALEKAVRNKKRAEDELAASQQLFKEEFISRAELEDDELKLIEAVNALATAQLDIQVYDKFTKPKEQRKVESDVEQAAAELDRTLRKNASELERASAELLSKTRALKIREDRLTKLKEQLENTVVRAPQDGMVVYATTSSSRYRSREPISQGRNVQFNELLLTLPDTSQMVAALKVHEAMMPLVKPGQPANVTIDARPGAPVRATVASVAIMAEDGGWLNPDLREYRVKVDLPPGHDAGLKPGMRCSGQIVIGTVENAVAVPVQAVFTQGRVQFVYVASSGGKVQPRPVKIGQSSETYAQVLEGLEVGDSVLLRGPRPGEVVADASQIIAAAAAKLPQQTAPAKPAAAPAARPAMNGQRPRRDAGENADRPRRRESTVANP